MVKNNTAETEFERDLSTVCSTFKISCLNAYQLTAIKEFVRGNSDIFVNLPTRYGKLPFKVAVAIMGLTGLRDSHVRVLAQMKVFALTENILFPKKIAVSPVKFSFSAGFSSYRMPFIVWRICVIVTDQRSFSGCAFCSLDRLLFLLSDCFSLYTLCVSNSIGACSCRGNYITRYVGKI